MSLPARLWMAVLAENPYAPPAEFAASYASLEDRIREFEARRPASGGKGIPSQRFSAGVTSANARRGRILLRPMTIVGIRTEIAGLGRLGVNAGCLSRRSPWKPAAYLAVSSEVSYSASRLRMAARIPRAIQPDYQMVGNEPDTEAIHSGQTCSADPRVVAALVRSTANAGDCRSAWHAAGWGPGTAARGTVKAIHDAGESVTIPDFCCPAISPIWSNLLAVRPCRLRGCPGQRSASATGLPAPVITKVELSCTGLAYRDTIRQP